MAVNCLPGDLSVSVSLFRLSWLTSLFQCMALHIPPFLGPRQNFLSCVCVTSERHRVQSYQLPHTRGQDVSCTAVGAAGPRLAREPIHEKEFGDEVECERVLFIMGHDVWGILSFHRLEMKRNGKRVARREGGEVDHWLEPPEDADRTLPVVLPILCLGPALLG